MGSELCIRDRSTAYNERIAILDGSNYTTSSGIGPGIGISNRKKNGLNASFKISSNSSQIDNQSTHFISQIGLTKKNFGGTITTNLNNDFEAYGIATFYKPKNFPSISASIEYKDMDSGKIIKNWVFALQQSLQNKKIGIAVGTYNSEEKIGYEGWSEINISDNLKNALVAKSNIFIMPSVIHNKSVEGFGIAFVEAAQYGIPSIGGKDGGASDAIKNNETGIICDGNNLEEIYSSIDLILKNNSYLEMGKKAKEYSSKFDWGNIVKEYLRIL